MDTYQRQLLQRRLSNFQDEVIATELFDSLPCLTDEQKDQIAYDEKNHLPSKGVRTLVEKLEEHKEGFEQFVHALCKADLGHVAVLLDANFEGLLLCVNYKFASVCKKDDLLSVEWLLVEPQRTVKAAGGVNPISLKTVINGFNGLWNLIQRNK